MDIAMRISSRELEQAVIQKLPQFLLIEEYRSILKEFRDKVIIYHPIFLMIVIVRVISVHWLLLLAYGDLWRIFNRKSIWLMILLNQISSFNISFESFISNQCSRWRNRWKEPKKKASKRRKKVGNSNLPFITIHNFKRYYISKYLPACECPSSITMNIYRIDSSEQSQWINIRACVHIRAHTRKHARAF